MKYIHIHTHTYTYILQGFGHIQFADTDDLDKAINMKNVEIMGRPVCMHMLLCVYICMCVCSYGINIKNVEVMGRPVCMHILIHMCMHSVYSCMMYLCIYELCSIGRKIPCSHIYMHIHAHALSLSLSLSNTHTHKHNMQIYIHTGMGRLCGI
jgi:hypothetical protein